MYAVGCDDLQFFCKKSFGSLIFKCRLPKETSLSIWGTFTMFPILTAFEACFLLCHFLVEVSQVIQGSYKDAHWYSEPEVG